MGTLQVMVRFNSNHSFIVRVNTSWTIARFKQEVGRVQGVPSDQIHILFAGRDLPDSLRIQDCGLGQQTVVHAISGLPQLSVDARSHATAPRSLSDPCKAVKPGKLRVRCGTCRQTTLTLNRDPACWEDVLVPRRIQGRCLSSGCAGTVAEFYFKCADHPTSEDDTSVALPLVRTNTQHVDCLACTYVRTPVMVFECADSHVMCLDCFARYCVTKLNDRQFIQHPTLGYTLPCPGGCDNSLIKEVHHFRMLGEEQYDRYHRFGAEECVLQMGGVLCPGRGCGVGILPDGNTNMVECVRQAGSGCGLVFCKVCKEAYHTGPCGETAPQPSAPANNYRVDTQRARRARWERRTAATIARTTKACPGCKVRTEKNDGCMHMTCPRCHFQWCWLCEREWGRNCQDRHWFGERG
ncbi:regulation of intralumenal vesicle formation [Branchiostoma belcheri]|nr:regulation of intralumenal vesicle formation [Branchiostoma belcheri]